MSKDTLGGPQVNRSWQILDGAHGAQSMLFG